MPEPPLRGGELNAAVTSVLVGIHNEYLGRGPKTASTFHYGTVPVTLMPDVLTHAEKSVRETNQTDAVTHIRLQETMQADVRRAVERLSGRKVLAFTSGNHIDPESPPNCSSSRPAALMSCASQSATSADQPGLPPRGPGAAGFTTGSTRRLLRSHSRRLPSPNWRPAAREPMGGRVGSVARPG